MLGINAQTGQPLSGIDHLRQSIRDILTTRIGTRVMRRDYGSRLPALVDNPMTPRLAMDLYSATAEALARWEPRFKLTVEVLPAELIPVTVAARIWLYPDTPMAAFDAIGARFKEALAAQSGLGWDLTPSWVIGELQRPGVHKVEMLAPTTDIRANANQAVRLMHLNLEFAGRDR